MTIDLSTAGERVAAWRGYVGLSQQILAERISLSRDTLSRKERGAGGACFDTRELAAVAKALGIEDAELLGLTPDETSTLRRHEIIAAREGGA